MSKIKIGVTGTGSLVGQAIIKSIKNSSLKGTVSLIGFDYVQNTIGSYWVDKNIILPDFLKKGVSEDAWLSAVLSAIAAEDIKILLIGIDFELKLFARHRKTIESKTKCAVMVSDPNVIAIADDKYRTYRFLKENGLSYPETILTGELNAKNLSFPCILKPRIGAGSKDVFVAHNRQELDRRLPLIKDPIIQELAGDTHSEYTCGIICLDNAIKDMIVLRRYLKAGHTETAYCSKDTPRAIYEYVRTITALLNPYGACNFQMRTDGSGTPRLFEINARHSGTTYMRAMFGFNEVEFIVRHVLKMGTVQFNLKYGIVKRYHEEMFVADSIQ